MGEQDEGRAGMRGRVARVNNNRESPGWSDGAKKYRIMG